MHPAWIFVIAGGVVWLFWYNHTSTPPKNPQSASAKQVVKCDEQATNILKKIGNFKLRRPANIDYINAYDRNNNFIGLVVLAQEPKAGKVTLQGTEYSRLPDMQGNYFGDYAVDMAKHSTHTSSKELLERICKVDPANAWIFRDPQTIKADLVQKFGVRS